MLHEYLKKIADTTAQGDAREESYYSHLSSFFQSFAESIDRKKIQITTLPKKTEAGNPDFRIWDGQQQIVGYIEAKKPGENLDVIENSEQLKRYRGVFPNLILTDFYEFRLYRNGQLIDKTFIGRQFIAKKLKTVGNKGRKPNISKEVIEKLEKAFGAVLAASPATTLSRGRTITPENILHYCYAVLYSNTYREKYAEFLKIDFPRIPFTSDYKLFLQLAELGEQLTELHLLKHKSLNRPVVKYKGKGDDRIGKLKYDLEKQILFINAPLSTGEGSGVRPNYFEGITPEVWNYHIGGYQVMEKYLKDRKGRLMNDPGHYCKMATALAQTIEIQKNIDSLFPKVEAAVII